MKVQESANEYFEEAREIAKIEKQQGIERWVIIGIYRQEQTACQQRVWKYDLPVRVAEKYKWVIRWRTARLQCMYPKSLVTTCYDYYRRVAGVNIGMQKELAQFVAAKAKITKQKNNISKYVTQQKNTNMFFDEETDEQLQKVKAKLCRAEEQWKEASKRLIAKVKEYHEKY